jgi:hypothetical protein
MHSNSDSNWSEYAGIVTFCLLFLTCEVFCLIWSTVCEGNTEQCWTNLLLAHFAPLELLIDIKA